MYEDRNLDRYGWLRYGNNDVFKNIDNFWLHDIIVKIYNHDCTSKMTYQHKIEERLKNEKFDRIATNAIAKCGMRGDIY